MIINRESHSRALKFLMQKRKICLWVGLTSMAAVLFINPRLSNPPVIAGQNMLASNTPPAAVVSTLRNACYDCHSDETKWPWYSHVAPVSWWLADHVEEGRRRLNFSRWPHDDPKRAAKRWRDISSAVEDGYMPMKNYSRMHPEARLTEAQREQLIQWAYQEAERLRPTDESQ